MRKKKDEFLGRECQGDKPHSQLYARRGIDLFIRILNMQKLSFIFLIKNVRGINLKKGDLWKTEFSLLLKDHDNISSIF